MNGATRVRLKLRDTAQVRVAHAVGCSPARVSRLLKHLDLFVRVLGALELEVRDA